MNPAYRQARFRAELPHGGLPERIAVITACNPEGKIASEAENRQRTAGLHDQLARLGHEAFPVTGYDAGSPHQEPGFGVLCPLANAYAIGNALNQEAIFWIDRGQVNLVPCLQKLEVEPLRPWTEMADASASPRFHLRGPLALLDHPATAFLCSTRCPGDKILEAYDWARRQCDEGGTVISGFHTPVEKDVLAILARRGANILLATARDLPKTTPKELQPAAAEGRLLILSPFAYGHPSRPTRESCSARNRFVLGFTTSRFIPHADPGSSLWSDLAAFPTPKTHHP